ncbi:hypothetical protein UP09_16500 [Bradyrhizobium sp. LTSP885]|uniref:hypothetical protein n=1 Tax=Bradyrhizobium sp. LTSP885 TaxID=1619232 RepID=UPI0005C99902|nr:hypothetical protein [Bradyrhizobium sp. LTSP885]KJC43947.1 hypothetical protein UP09_16500 [Bradyrhizobium sp. LTSP885]
MRPKKSADELAALIKEEVRKHPDWSHILDVSIDASHRPAPQANWLANFVTDGPRTAGAALPFVQRLAGQYDCSEFA